MKSKFLIKKFHDTGRERIAAVLSFDEMNRESTVSAKGHVVGDYDVLYSARDDFKGREVDLRYTAIFRHVYELIKYIL